MDFAKAYNIILHKLQVWLRSFIALLPNIVLAAIVVAIGLLLAKYIRKLVCRIMGRFSTHQALINLLSSFVSIVFGATAIFIALSILKLDKAVTTMLAGAGVIGLALAFAFQDIAANFMSGVFLSLRRPIGIGDIVKVKEQMGIVEAINLRDTVLRTFRGYLVIIPNKDVFQNPIENYSRYKKRRYDLTVGISYAEDLEVVKELTLKTLEGMEGLSSDEKTTLVYTEFSDSTINFTVRLWTDQIKQGDYLDVGSRALMRLKKAYDKAGISLPYPIRTLDFGIKGGVSLAEMLEGQAETK